MAALGTANTRGLLCARWHQHGGDEVVELLGTSMVSQHSTLGLTELCCDWKGLETLSLRSPMLDDEQRACYTTFQMTRNNPGQDAFARRSGLGKCDGTRFTRAGEEEMVLPSAPFLSFIPRISGLSGGLG